MNDSIDNLSIAISASAGDAIARIKELTSSMSGLKQSVRNAASNVKQWDDEMGKVGGTASEAGKETEKFGKDAENAGKSAARGASGIDKFISSLKRILFYRMIRSVIRSITAAFKEGITNAYNWSKAVNGQFAQSMDRIATSVLYLKNSLGAMLIPIINKLAPVIDWIIDRIVEVINWINKLFAALSGSQTYTVAKKVATTWGNAADNLETSSGKALENVKETVKELKKTILAFDEINKLEKQDDNNSYGGLGGGGSSGGSSSAQDFTNMFEERKLDGWMSKLAAFINKLKLGVPALLAGILAGWLAIKAVVKAVVGLLKKFWEKLKEVAGKVIDIPIRLIKLGWNSLKEWVLGLGTTVITVGVALATSAKKLWEDFKVEWAKAGVKIFTIGVTVITSAKALWEKFREDWQKAGAKVFSVSIAVTTTAKALWENFKSAWARAGVKVLAVSIAVTTTAKKIWEDFKAAWATAGTKVLAVGIALTTSAAKLWSDFKAAWAQAGVKVLAVSIALTTTAKTLWNNFKAAWDTIGTKVVAVGVGFSITAKQLWDAFKGAWDKAGAKVLTVAIGISITAKQLWNAFKSAWTLVGTKVLSVAIGLTTTAAQLWEDIKKAWDNITAKVLTISFAPVKNVATSLKTKIERGWKEVTSSWSLGVNVKPEFAADGNVSNVMGQTWYEKAWNWIKTNWKVVAAAGLGVAVAVALATTPVGLATAVSGLWAKAVALLGGGLAISVVPGLAESGDPYYSSGSQYTQEWYDKNIKPLEGFGGAKGGGGKSNGGGVGRNSEVVSTVQEYEKTIAQTWANVISNTATSWSKIQGQVMQALTNLEKGIDIKLKSFASKITSGWKNIADGTATSWTGIQGQVMQGMANLDTGIDIKMKSYKGKVSNGWNDVLVSTNKAWHDVQTQVLNALSNLEKGVKGKMNSIKSTANNVNWSSIGSNIVNGIADGINSGWGWLENTVWNLAISLYDTARYALGIASPSKLFSDKIGKMIDAGIVSGIDNGKMDVLTSITKMGTDMAAQLQSPEVIARMNAVGNYTAGAAGAMAGAYASNAGDNNAILAEYVRSGVADATYQQNELLKQQNEILRQLLDKPVTAEISTNAIVQGFQRKNKRDGTTVVPVY